MTYQVKRIDVDPFCIICSDGPMDEIECWEDTTIVDLMEEHSWTVAADSHLTEIEREAYAEEFGWTPTPEDFWEWLEREIKEGFIRTIK